MSKDDRLKTKAGAGAAPAPDKEARLAEALRANLKRRKSVQKKPASSKTSP